MSLKEIYTDPTQRQKTALAADDGPSTRELIDMYSIPHGALAQMCDVSPQVFSRFLQDPGYITNAERREKVEETIYRLLEFMDTALPSLPAGLTLNWKNPKAVLELIELCNRMARAEGNTNE